MNAPLEEYMVQHFASRTKKNLKFIEVNKRKFGADVNEVTQLINSTMGILLFPVEHIFEQANQEIPESIKALDWESKFRYNKNEPTKYEKLSAEAKFLRLCRNAFAHGNIYLGEADKSIKDIKLWNFPGRSRNEKDIDWSITISIEGLRDVLLQIADVLENQLKYLDPNGLGRRALSEPIDLLSEDTEQAAD